MGYQKRQWEFFIILKHYITSERSIVHYLYEMDFTFNINLIAQRGQVQSTLVRGGIEMHR